MQPLVSILIPAYNAQDWIADTLRSAIAQTWQRKEIVVVDDGSTDLTLAVARRFESKGIRVMTQENQGASAARNYAFRLSQGDFIQWLDADDLLAPDKIERQLLTSREFNPRRTLLSSSWAYFGYRKQYASFVPTALWQDLSPVEWLLLKMSQGLHMQPATWLTSREMAEAAGPFDIRLSFDDDGEYFCRVLLASEGTCFVPQAKVFYRVNIPKRLSYIGHSDQKKNSLFLSMKLHLQYLRSLEDSERVRKACLAYMQTWYPTFYPERPDIVAALQSLAVQLQGQLEEPRLGWKYAWMKPVFGWKVAKWAQMTLPQLKTSCISRCAKVAYNLKRNRVPGSLPIEAP